MTGGEFNICALFICGIIILIILYLIQWYVNRGVR